MQKIRTFDVVKSYLAATLAVMAIALLISQEYLGMNFVPILALGAWGTLIVAIFAMIGQTIYTNSKHNEHKTQLHSAKERLVNEIKHRHWAEKTSSEGKEKLQFIDENLPVLFAYFNVSQRCRFHNQAYRRWFGLKSNQINGHLLQEFSSPEFCLTIRTCIKDVLAGRLVFNESMHKSAKGQPCQLAEQIVPHFDNKRKVIGFYTLYTPRITDSNQFLAKHSTAEPAALSVQGEAIKAAVPSDDTAPESDSELSAAHIIQAIDNGAFQLYCQKISPVNSDSNLPIQYEVLLRMAEEENNLLPPGAFLPCVERYNLMPRLDRWVVERIVKQLHENKIPSETIYCINVAKSTLSNTDFPEFVRNQLQKLKIAPNLLSFEIEESDVLSAIPASQTFTKEIRKLGCLVSLCSFNYSRASIDLLKKMDINSIKIDGSLICNILRDEEDLSKIEAINKIAHSKNIQTIAELVEDNEVIIKLNEIGVDYAQGFGVAVPQPLDKLN